MSSTASFSNDEGALNMSTYRVIKPTEGEIVGAVQAALAKAGVDCGYEIRITLHNHALMKLTDETVASGTHFIVPETVAKQHAAGEANA